MECETQEPVRDLDELQNSDWVTPNFYFHATAVVHWLWGKKERGKKKVKVMEPHLAHLPPLPRQARFWVQVMRDLRDGVKLKKVQERQYNPLPIEYQLTPYEMLMDDIRSKRYKLRKVMVRKTAVHFNGPLQSRHQQGQSWCGASFMTGIVLRAPGERRHPAQVKEERARDHS